MSWGSHARFGFASLFRLCVVVLALSLAAARGAFAVDPLNVGFSAPSIDLLPYLAGLETDVRSVQIKRPDGGAASMDVMKLDALGAGPVFRWVAAGLRNDSAEARDLVIVIPDQGFIGSGLRWPRTPGSRVVTVTSAGPVEVTQLPVVGRQAYAFRLDAGRSAAIAFEIERDKLPVATIWQREAFEQQKDYLSFFRGALLGISVLLTIAMCGTLRVPGTRGVPRGRRLLALLRRLHDDGGRPSAAGAQGAGAYDGRSQDGPGADRGRHGRDAAAAPRLDGRASPALSGDRQCPGHGRRPALRAAGLWPGRTADRLGPGTHCLCPDRVRGPRP